MKSQKRWPILSRVYSFALEVFAQILDPLHLGWADTESFCRSGPQAYAIHNLQKRPRVQRVAQVHEDVAAVQRLRVAELQLVALQRVRIAAIGTSVVVVVVEAMCCCTCSIYNDKGKEG